MISWRQRVRDLEAENDFLRSKVEELERRLLAYENAHTPPSLSKKKRPPKQEGSGKLGAPVGHPRYERKEPEPTGSVKYIEDTCPDCHSKLGNPFRTERILEEEIPEPQPVEVIEHLVNHYVCPNCKKQVVARNNAPKRGIFGKNVQAHVTLLKYDDRLPLRKVVTALERHYGISMTNVAALNITEAVAQKLQKPYIQTIKMIRSAAVIYIDETRIKVNGLTYWIWTFVTETETVFVIRRSRAKKVIEEILGGKYKGIVTCDGWSAYTQYTDRIQRCWAHLIREAKHLAEKYTEFEGFYAVFKQMFEELSRIRDIGPPHETRVLLRKNLETRMEQLINQINAYTEFRKFGTKVKNGMQYWFTCITHLFVEPTNNNAERALRELVVQRKIIGGLRKEKGASIMETITTMVATWKKQHLPVFQTLKSYL